MSDFLMPENGLTVVRGASKTLELEVTEPDPLDPTLDKPVNLTGARVIFTVKRFVTDQHPLIQKTTDAPTQAELTEPRLGKARIYLYPEDTQHLAAANHVFDVWVVLSSGKRYVVVPTSIFEVQVGVTLLAL